MKPLIRILKIYVQHLDIFKERENSLLITHDHFDPFFFFSHISCVLRLSPGKTLL